MILRPSSIQICNKFCWFIDHLNEIETILDRFDSIFDKKSKL